MFTSVLVGVDGSRHGLDAVRGAAEIAAVEWAALTLITVYSSVVPWPLTIGPGVTAPVRRRRPGPRPPITYLSHPDETAAER